MSITTTNITTIMTMTTIMSIATIITTTIMSIITMTMITTIMTTAAPVPARAALPSASTPPWRS